MKDITSKKKPIQVVKHFDSGNSHFINNEQEFN